MPDVRTLHQRACEDFLATAAGVRPEQWQDPTPCEGWTVRDLVGHLAYENRWTPLLLAGMTMEEVGDRFEGDLLGDDPVGALSDAVEAALAAVAQPGVLERTVHLSFGDAPAEEYLWQLFADHLIHRWDLARATGQDERVDPELLAPLVRWFAEREQLYRAAGVIGPRAAVPDDADEQDRLLAAFGRDPRPPG